MSLAAWQIRDDKPERLSLGAIELEKVLESWIADDPGLVDRNLLVIQRQLHVEGGYLDLLCVDLQGQATVIEIKRGKLIRETIAQAIDYASSIASLPVETLERHVATYLDGSIPGHPGLEALLNDKTDGEREVAIVVVGVGAEPGLERMIDYLGSRASMLIRAVSFEVFALADGARLLIREETEPEPPEFETGKSTIGAVVERAGGPTSDPGRQMLMLAEAAERHGLYIRPHKWSLMFAPPAKKYRHLITVWRWTNKAEVAIQYSADAFAEFYPVAPERVRALFGLEGDGKATPILTDADARRWVSALDQLFDEIGVENEPSKTAESV